MNPLGNVDYSGIVWSLNILWLVWFLWDRVIDTLLNLYSKTHFRVKRHGKLSMPISSLLGVNQGGIASGLLFRKYLDDLDHYLKKDVGVCINETLIAHLLWADDLILFSNTEQGIQKQLDGIKNFCNNNKIIVNETKTKVMTLGKMLFECIL